MKKIFKIAYLRKEINWEREGIFDKYFINALLKNSKLDVYVENPPKKIPKYFKQYENNLNIYKLTNFGFTFLTYIKIYFKLKKIEKSYDFLITDHQFYNVANAILDSKKSIIYYHSPERSFYDLYHYRLKNKSTFRKFLQYLWVWSHRPIDNYFVSKIQNAVIMTNSNNVSTRIYKYYKKYSYVLHPAPATRKNTIEVINVLKNKKYFLVVNRFVPEKRLEIILNVFKILEVENLVLVGWSNNEKYIEFIKNKVQNMGNVIILNKISNEKLNFLYKNCSAVIQTNLDEDFGMVPIEAMEFGRPVIAVSEGGFEETVINNFNGILIHQPYEDNLLNCLLKFKENSFDSKKIKKYVKENYSYIKFEEKLWKYLLKFSKK